MSYGPPNNPQDPQQQQNYQQPPQQQGYQQPAQQQGYTPPPQAYGSGQKPDFQQMSAGFKRFSLGRQLVVGGGLAAVILFFFPWWNFGAGFGGISATLNGLRGLPMLAFLIVLVVTIAMALPLFGRRLSQMVNLPISEGQVALFGSGAALALSFLGVIGDFSFVAWGFWLAFLAMAAMTAGGWLMFQGKE